MKLNSFFIKQKNSSDGFVELCENVGKSSIASCLNYLRLLSAKNDVKQMLLVRNDVLYKSGVQCCAGNHDSVISNFLDEPLYYTFRSGIFVLDI